jgi:hypothetical protein
VTENAKGEESMVGSSSHQPQFRLMGLYNSWSNKKI